MTTVGPPDPRHTDGCATWHHHLIAGVVASYADCVYVEIGVLFAACYKVAAPFAREAHGVDPDYRCGPLMEGIGTFWHMSSDQFFEAYNGSTPDVIFVDGEHCDPFPARDVKNAFKILSSYGTVVLHDSQPIVDPEDGPHEDLSGHVWKTRAQLERNSALECFTFQRFPGVTLVRQR